VGVKQLKTIDGERGVQPSLSIGRPLPLRYNGENFNCRQSRFELTDRRSMWMCRRGSAGSAPAQHQRACLASPEMDICYKAARRQARRGPVTWTNEPQITEPGGFA
jgi:hypothetical protein